MTLFFWCTVRLLCCLSTALSVLLGCPACLLRRKRAVLVCIFPLWFYPSSTAQWDISCCQLFVCFSLQNWLLASNMQFFVYIPRNIAQEKALKLMHGMAPLLHDIMIPWACDSIKLSSGLCWGHRQLCIESDRKDSVIDVPWGAHSCIEEWFFLTHTFSTLCLLVHPLLPCFSCRCLAW